LWGKHLRKMSNSGNQVSLPLELKRKIMLKLQMKAMIQRLNHNQQEEILLILTSTGLIMTSRIQMMTCLTLRIAIKRERTKRNYFQNEEGTKMNQEKKIDKLHFKNAETRKKLALSLPKRTAIIAKKLSLKTQNQLMMKMRIKMRTKKVPQKEKKRSWLEREEKVHACKPKKSLGLQLVNLKRGVNLIRERPEEAIKRLKEKEIRKSDLNMLVPL
jgi:hypothetical protein